jgi:hypothetical protein
VARKRGFRFIPYDEWAVRSHKAEPPAGLWWWQALLPEERKHVLCVYFERRTYNTKRFNAGLSLPDRWQRVCEDFKSRCAKQRGTPDEIQRIIRLVMTADTTSSSKDEHGHFMTLEGAAIKLRLKRKNVYSWFNRIDEISRELYADRCSAKGEVTITEEVEQAIRAEYLSKGNARELSERFRLPPFRIGQIVKAEKKLRKQRHTVKADDDVPY